MGKLKVKTTNKKIVEINSSIVEENDLKSFLLTGPIFSKAQLDKIAETRKAINQWRTK